jgi:hypothetical protein
MTKKMTPEMAAIMRPSHVSDDKLETLRKHVREHRDLLMQVRDAEDALKTLKKKLNDMESKELPDLFHAAGVDSVGLPAEGNLPAYDATLKPYYHANIPEQNRPEAFGWLHQHGFGDIVKTVFKIEFGLCEDAPTQQLQEQLDKLGVEYSKDMNVPWKTLTAWLKERMEKRDTDLPSLSIFGATVGTVVKLKERRK